jgi:geranylgeranyl reductase family protein
MTENPKSKIQNPKSFDVLIVGAGPAGSFAAELLAKQGASVALFDGRPEGEPKPCGGGVTSKALKAYPQLLQAVGRTIDDLEMFAPSGKRLYLKLDEPFAIYARTVFDSFLRDRAAEAGATVIKEKVSLAEHENDLWTLRGYGKSNSVFQGKFLIAADGANSAIAKKLSGSLAKSEMEVAFGYRIPFNGGEQKTIIAFLPDFAGYAWAFPRLDHTSFGIATAQDAFNHEELDRLLWQFIVGCYVQKKDKKAVIWQSLDNAQNIELKKELETKAERYAARIPGLTPETLDSRKTCGANWALLGDAAGFADAVTGEGIYYALRSAELFADCFANGKDYETAWREDFGRELHRASQMRRRFYGNFFGASFTERMIQFAALHGGIRKTIRELVAGDQGYTDLKQTLAKRALLPF